MIMPPRGWFRIAPFALAIGLAASLASAATFMVDSTGDESDADLTDGICRTALGTCTLRAAIEQANALAGVDTIAFNIPGAGVHSITPSSPLPELTDDAGITIDGYTQPGSSPNTLTIGDNAVLTIELDGTNAGQSANGLVIQGLSATVRGLVVNRFAFSGIWIAGGFGHQVSGCFLGTDPVGKVAMGNRVGLRIDLSGQLAAPAASTTSVVVVGGSAAAARNLISGNLSAGLAASSATNSLIQNNYVGTDSSGTSALSNQGGGISLLGSNITVGGAPLLGPGGGLGRANVVSGNIGSGILISGGPSRISGNLVGTDATGTFPLPNGTGIQGVRSFGDFIFDNVISGNSFYGIRLSSIGASVEANYIGTDLSGTNTLGNALDGVAVGGNSVRVFVGNRNVIAFNGGSGISVGFSGTDASNDNLISRNSIHDNGGLGIDLGNDGVTANDDCDLSRGPNLLQNYPVLNNAVSSSGTCTVDGSLNSAPNTQFYLEFFSNTRCSPSGYGEGETFIGSTFVMTDGSCKANVQATFPTSLAPGSFITSTATDPAGNTSEFSACLPVVTSESFYTVTPCRVADTRNPAGPYGGPPLTPAADRAFVVAGQCGIPPDARAVAFNFAVTQPSVSGDLQVFPGGTPLPAPATVYYSAGQTRAKNSIFALGLAGDIGTHVDQAAGTVHLVIDVTGYFR